MISYTLLQNWSARAALPAGLSNGEAALLFSEGSLTLELETLFGSRVDVELCHKGVTRLRAEDAAYLDEPPGTEAADREVWLLVEGRRFVYARTLIPSGRIDGALLSLLEENEAEPLGRVLSSSGIPLDKTRLEVGALRCPEVALALGLGPEIPLAARRYILYNRKKDGAWLLKAAVTEIFSPGIVPGAPLVG